MSKELSNREQKFRDEYMDILYQAIRKEHPPGKYLLLDKDDLRKLTELFKRVYQEGEYIDMNDIKEFLTCLLYTSPSPRDGLLSRMPSSA